MGRKEYTTCMVPWMRGGGPDRKLRFCTGAKICSGKAATEEEARQICISAPPKEPKTRKSRKKVDCVKELAGAVACMAPLLRAEALPGLTVNRLTEILQQCAGGPAGGKLSREKFLKKCYKENPLPGTMKEAGQLQSYCIKAYKEQEKPI